MATQYPTKQAEAGPVSPSPFAGIAALATQTGIDAFKNMSPVATPSLADLAAPAPAPDGSAAFEASLAASRGDVERLFGSVLGEIGKQNDLALGQVDQIPGQLKGIYDGANLNFDKGLSALTQAQQASGLDSYMPAESAAFPIKQALGISRASRESAVPMLRAGIAELASRQRAQAELAKAGQLADLKSEERSYLRSRAERDERNPVADALAEYEGRALIDQKYGIGDFAPAKLEAADEGYKLSDFGSHAVNPYRGQALTSEDPATVAKIKSDPRWQTDLAKTREIINKFAGDPAKVVAEIQKYFGKRDRSASLALWELGYTGE